MSRSQPRGWGSLGSITNATIALLFILGSHADQSRPAIRTSIMQRRARHCAANGEGLDFQPSGDWLPDTGHNCRSTHPVLVGREDQAALVSRRMNRRPDAAPQTSRQMAQLAESDSGVRNSSRKTKVHSTVVRIRVAACSALLIYLLL